PPEFFQFLLDLRFTGDLFALPEGTPVFANEPLAIVRAPLVEAQLVETYLLSTFAFQTTIASKAVRCVTAAEGRSVVEFGSRRAHSPEAGVLGGRAAYVGGCSGTSNTQSGMKFGIPVFGTAAHSWTMSFSSEKESFVQLQKLLGEATVFLIDTYDTLQGAHIAASLGRPCWGVRLDSGDLLSLSGEVRRILDSAGLQTAKIFATNDLDEYRVRELVRAGAPIDAFGIGTQLATSADAPALSAVYKLVELKHENTLRYAAKFSVDKSTLPGAKQVYRYGDHDLVALGTECGGWKGEPLVRPVLIAGEPLEALPETAKIQTHSQKAIGAIPKELLSLDEVSPYRVEVSPHLTELAREVRERLELIEAG
ncbi:MAG: nicotinate phosphoribosyltransferase, partial [Acidobacteriaceae bacterium]|nr:nicotinate phosphoribosyltransferase [Acidobacteriaceae bacterium]